MMNFNQIHSDGLTPSHMWFGVVEDVNDPLKIGRVRVRCFGYHAENKQLVPTSHLPWALVMMPSSSASMGGEGQTMGLKPGSWVVGFFMDGKKGQMPLVLGSFHHMHKPNPPGYGSGPQSSQSALPPMVNPPQFKGQPSGSDDVAKAQKPPVTAPGPSGSILQQVTPNGYNFSNNPRRSTGDIKEQSGYLYYPKDTAPGVWPSKYYSPQEVKLNASNKKIHRGTLLALDLATEKYGGKFKINDGARSTAEQAAAYRRHGSAGAARPGNSYHEHGRAFDISLNDKTGFVL